MKERVRIDDLRKQLLEHRLYRQLVDEESVRLFMRAHVFAVWDFQCLLKGLQRTFTCVSVPWLPSGDPQACRLVNEIVLEEESDEHPDGGYASHFELYLEAMEDGGADTGPIRYLIDGLRAGEGLDQLLAEDGIIPAGVGQFVDTTLSTVASGELHRMVSIFTFTREDMIPDMFNELIRGLSERRPAQWRKLRHYLERHVEIDGERHGPISHELLARVCGDDERLWREAEESARRALTARIKLWDAVAQDQRAARAA